MPVEDVFKAQDENNEQLIKDIMEYNASLSKPNALKAVVAWGVMPLIWMARVSLLITAELPIWLMGATMRAGSRTSSWTAAAAFGVTTSFFFTPSTCAAWYNMVYGARFSQCSASP